MAPSNTRSIALKWYNFSVASLMVYGEYCHLFMKQLGFNPQQIGVTTAFGAQNLLIPLLTYLGDKFRARNALIWIVTFPTLLICLLPLLPLVVSLPTCFEYPLKSNHSYDNALTHVLKLRNDSADWKKDDSLTHYQNVPWLSGIFILMIVSRPFTTCFEGVIQATASVATLTHVGKERTKYGSYYMWTQIGGCVAIVTTAVLAWLFRINICGVTHYGYFTAFIVASAFVVLSVPSLPWLEFKYEADRTIHFAEVKDVLFNVHYVYIYALMFYTGLCASFQFSWEFWYLDGLNASPLVLGGAALIRRPILAATIFTSSYVIKKLGDLNTLCVTFILLALSFLALSFTRVYWYVLAIDIFQAAAVGLAYSATAIHFSKAGSKATSSVIFGLQTMTFQVGADSGATLMGVLFHRFGTRDTLLAYAFVTAVVLFIFILYLKFSKIASTYQKVPEDSDDDDMDN